MKRTQATVPDNCSYQDLSIAAIYEAAALLATDQETLALSVTDHGIAIKIAIKPESTTHGARDITKHSERIDRQDSLQKMERELQGKPAATPIPTKKTKRTAASLPPVDIHCISAEGFRRTLIKPDAKPFITSLYEIDQIIEEKEVEAIQEDAARDELTNEELIA